MKMIIVGAHSKKDIKFQDNPVAIKVIMDSRRSKYYDFKNGKIVRSWTTKRNRLIDALIKSRKNNNE